MTQNLNPESFLTRKQLSAALVARGYPVSVSTLCTYATRPGGPAYRRFGRVALYRWDVALAWAQGRLKDPRSLEEKTAA